MLYLNHYTVSIEVAGKSPMSNEQQDKHQLKIQKLLVSIHFVTLFRDELRWLQVKFIAGDGLLDSAGQGGHQGHFAGD